MNNPNEIAVDVQEQIAWLIEHKSTANLSWTQLSVAIGIPGGTLSAFGGGKYAGDTARIATEVFRYRQVLAMQAQLATEAPAIPTYFETKTSRDIMNLLSWAQRGRLTVCATAPGCGKSTTAREYKARASNVWLLTMLKSTGTVNGLVLAMLAAMGDHAQTGITQRLSAMVMDRVRNTNGLIIVDDAQHCSVDQIEELRGWHDLTGIGIALLGNEKVIGRMEGGTRKAEFAQLYSRVGMRMIRSTPLAADVERLAEEWKVERDDLVNELKDIARKPGGLRSCTFALELAVMIARSENSDLELRHLKGAYGQLSTRPVAA